MEQIGKKEKKVCMGLVAPWFWVEEGIGDSMFVGIQTFS